MPVPTPATSIVAFFAQPVLTVAIRATYTDGQVHWPTVTGKMLDRDTSGLLLQDASGVVRYLAWNIIVSIRPGVQTSGGW